MSRRAHDQYERDLRRAQRRHDDEVPRTWLVLIIVLTLIVSVASVAYGVMRIDKTGKSAGTKAHDSLGPTYTYDGETIRWYVFVDPDTGVQYLVNDRGGCCIREESTEASR